MKDRCEHGDEKSDSITCGNLFKLSERLSDFQEGPHTTKQVN
jgi:hypothetical protein